MPQAAHNTMGIVVKSCRDGPFSLFVVRQFIASSGDESPHYKPSCRYSPLHHLRRNGQEQDYDHEKDYAYKEAEG